MSNTIKGIYTAELMAIDVAGIVYKQLKAKIFDLLESQLATKLTLSDQNTTDPKLSACKRIAESMITATAKDVKRFIVDTLGDWEQEVEAGGELTPPELCEAAKERKEIDDAVR